MGVAETMDSTREWRRLGAQVSQFLVDQQCDDDMIERVTADEAQRSTRTGSSNTA